MATEILNLHFFEALWNVQVQTGCQNPAFE